VPAHVIPNRSYAYEVDEPNAVIVLSGTTSATFFSYLTPIPSSRSYTFHVTATDRGNSTQAQATISQAAGFVLGLSFDRTSYGAGETVHAHLTLTAKGTGSLPSQFRWSLSSASASATAITTGPAADLFLTIPAGTGNGGLLVFANELNTGASAFRTGSCAPGAARPTSPPGRRNVHRRATACPAALGGQAMGDEDDLLKAVQKNDLAKAQEILDRHPPLLRMKTPNGTLVLTATF